MKAKGREGERGMGKGMNLFSVRGRDYKGVQGIGAKLKGFAT